MSAYNAYTCPTCGARMERDILLFYKHTDQHIVEEVAKSHPKWIMPGGFCPKCLDYVKQTLGRGGAENKSGDPVLANIGAVGARFRLMLAAACFAASGAAALYLITAGPPRTARLTLFIVLFAAFLFIFQARHRVCVIHAGRGTKEGEAGKEKVANPVLDRALRLVSIRILALSAAAALVLTLAVFVL